MERLKTHSILLGIIISLFLLLIATWFYPGGSQFDKNSVGFDWKNNYISNLFGEKSVNGLDSPSRIWAISGMMCLSVSFAIFFIGFSKKIPSRGAAKVVQYAGAGGMVFTFLIITPLHDTMITIASTMFLVSLFYITIFVFKSRLHFFKILCTVCLLIFYFTLFIFGTGSYRMYLPTLQKMALATTIVLILGLQYFTKREDFQHIKAKHESA